MSRSSWQPWVQATTRIPRSYHLKSEVKHACRYERVDTVNVLHHDRLWSAAYYAEKGAER